MHYDDIRVLPIGEIAAQNSVLWLWTTGPHVPTALSVMSAWGYRYVTVGFVWQKITKAGEDRMGLGHHTRSSTEFCLFGVRGRGLPRLSKRVRQLISAPVTKHSAKPIEAIDRLDMLYGDDVSKIELFARAPDSEWLPRRGWDYWGDEVIYTKSKGTITAEDIPDGYACTTWQGSRLLSDYLMTQTEQLAAHEFDIALGLAHAQYALKIKRGDA
jgi:site-specific DNA-methyltransferase (adenine-specific)